MRRTVLPALAALCAITASCSNGTPDPKTEWTNAMKSAGFAPNAPHTFDEMFESAKAFCTAGSALAISGIARSALNPEQADTTAMPARGKNPDQAASAYGNATWQWACGSTSSPATTR
jgi:allantoicase